MYSKTEASYQNVAGNFQPAERADEKVLIQKRVGKPDVAKQLVLGEVTALTTRPTLTLALYLAVMEASALRAFVDPLCFRCLPDVDTVYPS